MPTYEYKCPKCQVTALIKHPMDNHKDYHCTECLTKLQRVWRLGGVNFKGSGWGKDR